VKAGLSRLAPLLVLGALLGPPPRMQAQVTATAPAAEASQYGQRWDLYGGAQYAHLNPGIGAGNAMKAVSLLGWQGSATVWFRPLWGIEASARGVYGNLVVPGNDLGVPTNPPMSEHLFLFGPSFRLYRSPKITVGMHGLIGAAYGVFSSGFPPGITPQEVGIYNDKLAFGYVVGGTADYNVTPQWGVRFIYDWQPTHYGFSQQNEFAGSVGIVYKLGRLGK
jgi:hypothetical protein